MKRQKGHNHQGFTLVELIIVVAVMATLSGILAPVYAKHIKKARAVVCTENRDRLYREMNAEYADGTYDSLKSAFDDLSKHYQDQKLCPSKGTYSWNENGDGIDKIVCSIHGNESNAGGDSSGKTYPGTNLEIHSGIWPKSEDFKDDYEEITYQPSGIFEYNGSYYVITKELTLSRARAESGPSGEAYGYTATEKLTGTIREMNSDDKHIAGIHRGDLVKCGDSYYVYNAGDGGTPEGTWAPNPSGGSNVWYKIPQ